MDVTNFINYRDFLTKLIYGNQAKRGLQAQLSKAMGCQASYLSQVLKNKAELTEDHVVRLAKHLSFSKIEVEYILVLVRISRASTNLLKEYLEETRQQLSEQAKELKNKLSSRTIVKDQELFAPYFHSWIPSTIHIATSSPNFQTITTLTKRFGLTEEKVKEILTYLQQLGLVKKSLDKYVFNGDSMHLPRESVLDTSHQMLRRHQVARSLQIKSPENLHFSSLFTIDMKDFEKIRNQFLNSIKDYQKTINDSGTDDVCCLCIDLFRVV